MNEIETTYLELETAFERWSQLVDAFAIDVNNDDALRRRIDELKLKQRLGRSALAALRTESGKKWETTKVMVARAWSFWETSMDLFSISSQPDTARTLADATMQSRNESAHASSISPR